MFTLKEPDTNTRQFRDCCVYAIQHGTHHQNRSCKIRPVMNGVRMRCKRTFTTCRQGELKFKEKEMIINQDLKISAVVFISSTSHHYLEILFGTRFKNKMFFGYFFFKVHFNFKQLIYQIKDIAFGRAVRGGGVNNNCSTVKNQPKLFLFVLLFFLKIFRLTLFIPVSSVQKSVCQKSTSVF